MQPATKHKFEQFYKGFAMSEDHAKNFYRVFVPYNGQLP